MRGDSEGGNPQESSRAEAAAVRTPAAYSHEGRLVTQTDFNLFLRLTQVIKRLQKPVKPVQGPDSDYSMFVCVRKCVFV